MSQLNLGSKSAAKLCLTASALVWAGTASAFFDGDIGVGRRSGSWDQNGQSKALNASVTTMAAHLDPIPLVPVSFGLRFYSESYDATVTEHGVKSLTSTAVVPEVTAWFPFGDLAPFARIGYTAISAYTGTAEVTVANTTTNGSIAFKSKGPRLTVGLNYSILPLISVTAAFERSTETLSMSEGKIGGLDLKASSNDIKFSSNAMILGVKAGI